jgi:Lar family restriction alleviation protein
MNDELLPCPFCGGKAQLHPTIGRFWEAVVICDVCAAQTGDHTPQDSDATVIAAWNRRVGNPS